MENPAIQTIKKVNTSMFGHQPFLDVGSLKPLMIRVASFSRNYWPHIIAATLCTAVLAGFVFTYLDKKDA